MKSIEQLSEEFNHNEVVRLSVKRSEILRKAQAKGNKTRNRKREIERAFKYQEK